MKNTQNITFYSLYYLFQNYLPFLVEEEALFELNLSSLRLGIYLILIGVLTSINK